MNWRSLWERAAFSPISGAYGLRQTISITSAFHHHRSPFLCPRECFHAIPSRNGHAMTRLGASATLLLAALLWGSGNVANKTVLDHIDPLLAVALRCCFAVLILAPLALRDIRVPRAAGWLQSACTVTAFFAAAMALQQYAFADTTVTNAGFLVNTCSMLTPILAWVLLGERAPRGLVLAAVITLAGIFLMTGGHWSFATMRGGDVISLGSAACYAMWMVLLGQHLQRFARPVLICAFQFGASGIGLLALALVNAQPELPQLAAALPDLVYLGVISTGLAFLLQARAQQHVSASSAAVIASAESLFGAAGAYLLLGERTSATGFVGAGLILCGIGMAAFCMTSPVQTPPGNGSDSSSARRRVRAG
jgi:drug/metabolite transporter (DMT)-like permease